jgi:hypothetical protein
MGLSEYPFALHTAESEARKHDEAGLFIRPTHYGPIFPTYDAGASMFLIGDRGVGKTALTYDFVRTATSKAAALAVILDDFSSIKIHYLPADLYHLIAQAIVAKIFQLLKSSPALLSRFTADERVFLSYLRQQFFKPETKEQLDEEFKKLQFPM